MAHRRRSPEEVWAELSAGLNALTEAKKVTMTSPDYIKYYTTVYNECVAHSSDRGMAQTGACFNGGTVYDKLREYLIAYCAKIKEKAEEMNGENLLQYLNHEWVRYTHASKTMDGIFVYLNRHYVRRSNDTNSGTDSIGNSVEDLTSIEPETPKTCHDMTAEVYTLCMICWRDMIFKPHHKGIIEATLDLVAKERKGEMIDRNLIRGIKECLVNIDYKEAHTSVTVGPGFHSQARGQRAADKPVSICLLDVYEDYFVKPFLIETEAHYKAVSAQLLSENNITECMKKFNQFIEDERKRVLDYLDKTTADPLDNVCKETLITAHLEHYNSEFLGLLKDDKDDDVALMYTLLESVDKLSYMADTLQQHIHNYGLEQIEKVSSQAMEAPEIYSQAVLAVHGKFNTLVNGSFGRNPMFIESLDKACRQFVNKNAVTKLAKKVEKSSELLAKHCDGLLKKSSKVSDGELEEQLSRIMTVFVYIEDKHVFQTYYSKFLAKRLVNDMSLSDDAESSMISKLKNACGYEYTGKLQRMFTDISISKSLMDAFTVRLKDSASPLTHDFNVKIITDGSWPIRKSSEPFLFPPLLQKSLERFEAFYSDKHSGRRLGWIAVHSKGELKTTYLKRPVILSASAYQMAILNFFNTCTSATVLQLMDATEMKFPLMKANLELLNKTKLVKVEKLEDMSEETTVSLNMNFQSKKAKININVPIKAQKEADQKDTEKSIQQDRELIIQATLVRIMKMRKTMRHKELINESMEQLVSRFKPKMPLVKRMIDLLIEKDYISRADGQKDLYNYVA